MAEKFEKWRYGWFMCSGTPTKEALFSAKQEQQRFRTLVRGVERELGLNITGQWPRELTLEEIEKYQKLVSVVDEYVYLEGPWFVPDFRIVGNWAIYGEDLSAILSCVKNISKRNGLADPLPVIVGDLIETAGENTVGADPSDTR